MYLNLRTIAWLLRPSPGPRARTLRRGAAVVLGASLHASLYTLVSLGRACDHLLFPGFKKVPVERPVFVVATPRSGTTFLHHLLALDENQFTHFRLYQTVFPTVLTNRLIRTLGRVKGGTGLPIDAPVRWLNRHLFPGWDGIHQVGLDAEEEDESLFVYSLLSPALFLLSPFIERMPELVDIDNQPERTLRALAADYQQTARRHLFSEGLGNNGKVRTLLVKNVLLPSRLGVMRRAFPDARVIYLTRDPLRAIPSAMSLFFAPWRAHSPDISADSPETRALFRMFLHHYKKLATELQGSQVLHVKFEDLVADPVETVRRIYQFLGKPWSSEQEETLREVLSSSGRFKSSHDYGLKDFGLTEEDILAPLASVLGDLGYANSSGDPVAATDGAA